MTKDILRQALRTIQMQYACRLQVWYKAMFGKDCDAETAVDACLDEICSDKLLDAVSKKVFEPVRAQDVLSSDVQVRENYQKLVENDTEGWFDFPTLWEKDALCVGRFLLYDQVCGSIRIWHAIETYLDVDGGVFTCSCQCRSFRGFFQSNPHSDKLEFVVRTLRSDLKYASFSLMDQYCPEAWLWWWDAPAILP